MKLPYSRPKHSRRRKRDLVRTLSYLAALRILAVHRNLKWRLALSWDWISETLLHWGAISMHRTRDLPNRAEDEEEGTETESARRKRKKGVRWAADKEQPSNLVRVLSLLSPLPLLLRLPRWTIWLAALIFFRSHFFRTNAGRILSALQPHVLKWRA